MSNNTPVPVLFSDAFTRTAKRKLEFLHGMGGRVVSLVLEDCDGMTVTLDRLGNMKWAEDGKFFLVIQGAADVGTDWRDIEKLRDCEYARRVLPERLVEYRRGDCASARYTDYRIVRREVSDCPYVSNREVSGASSDEAGSSE